MPRPKVPGAPEPKKRSRTGCWTCKAKKVKCGEEKPICLNCEKNGEKQCDYSIRLNWEGRTKRKANDTTPEPADQGSGNGFGQMQMLSFQPPVSMSQDTTLAESTAMIDPALILAELPTSARDFSTQFPIPQKFSHGSCPLSSGSRINSPSASGPSPVGYQQSQMLPPFTSYVAAAPARHEGSSTASEHRDKRARPSSTYPTHLGHETPDYLSPHGYGPTSGASTSDPYSNNPKSLYPSGTSPASETYGKNTALYPLTPSTSSATSEDVYSGYLPKQTTPVQQLAYNDPRRLSVNSLLTQEEEAKADGEPRDAKSQVITYGTDRGLRDLDVPKNNDMSVIDVVTPVLSSHGFQDELADLSTEFGFGLFNSSTAKRVADYSEPLPVNIPKTLLPLPPMLTDNPMNLMYFHFFLEFTARILVPHDCPENPFKVILPQMAVRDDNLLHLLLAYSASHRARLLGHPEPANRIALWVRDVFPNLRHALDDDAGQISNSNLATAIMLASLEIIAPNAFEVAVPWQDHLSIARSMIIARGGPRSVNRAKDRVSYFLIRWFAYLDVLGNFSSTGARADQAMFSPRLYDFEEQNDFQVDCVLGFSGHLASILAKIAELARRCDAARADAAAGWTPGAEVVAEAGRIEADLHATRRQRFTLCPHRQAGSSTELAWESTEMAATNEAFLWAGFIHLHRRILGLARDSAEVQAAVRGVLGTLVNVRPGGSAEACMLFPLFSAGCEAEEGPQREEVLERVKSVEGSGMTQVKKARSLMELVWETGKPWETLVQGEFFG